MAIATVNPATARTVRTFEPYDDAEIERRLVLAAEGHRALVEAGFAQRAAWCRRAADLFEAEADDLAATVTEEMGKPLVQARAEVVKSAGALRFYAEHAESFLAPEPLADPAAVKASAAGIRYQALGTVLAVMPWNFPVWQVIRFAAPALMAGNSALLKHASNVPQTALAIEDVLRRAGLPEGAFSTLLVGSETIEQLLADDRVHAVTLTGSEAAGASVAALAAAQIKKSVLELGGSDPFIVMPSADLDAAIETAVTARVQNNGQSCIAAKRFIVHAEVYDAFEERFTAAMAGLSVGDPREEGTDIGPLAVEAGRADLAELVEDAREHGARILTGGAAPQRDGWFYEPTVIADLTVEARLRTEEAFGPVAVLHRAADRETALALANETPLGLSSSVWTADSEDKEFFVDGLAAGGVFVNGMTVSAPELPFGGIKRSGYGRELAAAGIREFCNLKTVWEA